MRTESLPGNQKNMSGAGDGRDNIRNADEKACLTKYNPVTNLQRQTGPNINESSLREGAVPQIQLLFDTALVAAQ